MTNAEDCIAIQQVISRYSSVVSRRAWAELEALFTADASWEVIGGPGLRLDGPGLLPGIRALVEQNTESMFQMNCPAVIAVDGGRATATSNMYEFGVTPDKLSRFEAPGIYDDVLVRRDGAWRFASRRFTVLAIRTIPIAG
jgi:hypothetical protein